MTVYSADELMDETRRLAAKYRQTTGTTLRVMDKIARFDAAKALSLNLINDLNLGYDAVGTGELDGVRILIKDRIMSKKNGPSPRVGRIKSYNHWDVVVLVLFNDDCLPMAMYLASAAAIKQATERSDVNKRAGISVARFKIIGQLVWSDANGLASSMR